MAFTYTSEEESEAPHYQQPCYKSRIRNADLPQALEHANSPCVRVSEPVRSKVCHWFAIESSAHAVGSATERLLLRTQ